MAADPGRLSTVRPSTHCSFIIKLPEVAEAMRCRWLARIKALRSRLRGVEAVRVHIIGETVNQRKGKGKGKGKGGRRPVPMKLKVLALPTCAGFVNPGGSEGRAGAVFIEIYVWDADWADVAMQTICQIIAPCAVSAVWASIRPHAAVWVSSDREWRHAGQPIEQILVADPCDVYGRRQKCLLQLSETCLPSGPDQVQEFHGVFVKLQTAITLHHYFATAMIPHFAMLVLRDKINWPSDLQVQKWRCWSGTHIRCVLSGQRATLDMFLNAISDLPFLCAPVALSANRDLLHRCVHNPEVASLSSVYRRLAPHMKLGLFLSIGLSFRSLELGTWRMIQDWDTLSTSQFSLSTLPPDEHALPAEASWESLGLDLIVLVTCQVVSPVGHLPVEGVYIIGPRVGVVMLKALIADEPQQANQPQQQSPQTEAAASCEPLQLLQASLLPNPSRYLEYGLTELNDDDPMYGFATKLMLTTAAEHRKTLRCLDFAPAPRFRILKVERLLNARLLSKYRSACEDMEGLYHVAGCEPVAIFDHLKVHPAAITSCGVDLNELFAFHGASHRAISDICRGGFDAQRGGEVVGKMFGVASYFAINSSKSDIYTDDQMGGDRLSRSAERKMIIARLVLGRSFKTTEPCPDKHRPPDGFNSVWAERRDAGGCVDHREIMIYKDQQALPVFVVTYRHACEEASLCAECLKRPV